MRGMRAMDFEMCSQMVNKITAENALQAMTISQYPHAKTEWRKQVHKQFYSIAYPPKESAQSVSMEDFAKLLSGGK